MICITTLLLLGITVVFMGAALFVYTLIMYRRVVTARIKHYVDRLEMLIQLSDDINNNSKIIGTMHDPECQLCAITRIMADIARTQKGLGELIKDIAANRVSSEHKDTGVLPGTHFYK